MKFNFVFPEDEEEELISFSEDEPEELEVDGIAISFETAVPTRKTLADPEVKDKAQRTRKNKKRSVSNRDYAGKRSAGWSYCCAHKQHLSALCERYQTNGEISCTCDCHRERGYVRPELVSVSGSDDEEYILFDD